MSVPEIKGYCPGALRPMATGDGFVVRVRPFGGRVSAKQAAGIAALSDAHGNGKIDLSNRANLQIRGVPEAEMSRLLDGLASLSLLDSTVAQEARRNLIVTPFFQQDDDSARLSAALAHALTEADDIALPGKFGFAIDTGPTPVLQSAPADIRIERCGSGGLIVVADGLPVGKPVSLSDAAPTALDLARWFQRRGGTHKRMAPLVRSGVTPDGFDQGRQIVDFEPEPGVLREGVLVGLPFGQIDAAALAALARLGPLRLTPWRMVLVEGAEAVPAMDGVITDPDNPLLRVDACVGSHGCAQGLGETRPLARALAPFLKSDARLHVSGCAKGCARPAASALTLTAAEDGYSLIRNGRANDAPEIKGLTASEVRKVLT